jgi:hypothetical protein
MAPRTIFLARLIGLFVTVLALAMIANRPATTAAFIRLTEDPSALWLSGMVGVAAGLAVVLGHNRWSGGALAVVVTMVGWTTLIKSVVVLLLPAGSLGGLPELLRSPAFYYADAAFLLALGLYLTIGGFKAVPHG